MKPETVSFKCRNCECDVVSSIDTLHEDSDGYLICYRCTIPYPLDICGDFSRDSVEETISLLEC